MPTVKKTTGAPVHIRGVGEFDIGDRVDVGDEMAAYLCEERGDFDVVDDEDDVGEGEAGGGDEDEAGYLRDQPPAVQIDEGVCPWCPPNERYEGTAVGQHASSAHPDEWAAYKED